MNRGVGIKLPEELFGRPQASGRRQAALAVAFSRAWETLERVLGRSVVEEAVAARRALLQGRGGGPSGFMARVVAVAETIEHLHHGHSLLAIRPALEAALVANAARTARGAAGAEALFARLPGRDGDQAGFELLAGATIASRLGDAGRGLRFLPPARDSRTPDAEVRLGSDAPDAPWAFLECKRQDDRSGDELRRDRITQHVRNGIHREVDRVGVPVAVYAVSKQEPTDSERQEIVRMVRRCLQVVRGQPNDAHESLSSDVAGGTRVAVHSFRHLPPGVLPPMQADEVSGFTPSDFASSQSNFRLLPRADDPRPRYVMTLRLGPVLGNAGAIRRLNEARSQLTTGRPGIVAVWLREGGEPEREATAALVRAAFSPAKNTRISGVLLAWLDPDPILAAVPSTLLVRPALLAPNLDRALGALWIPNPHARFTIPHVTT